jgi:predicted phage tail protein
MKRTWFLLLLALATLGVAATLPGQSTIQTSAVRILRPSAGQALTNSFVTLRFELVRPNPAGGDNNFVIQLDALEPVNTSENEYTFTGVLPGRHVISVKEVDANGTPLPDASTEVQFTVKSPESTAPPAK